MFNIVPGLHDDVALLCLARLPYNERVALRCVSRAWRKALGRPKGPRLILCEGREQGRDATWHVFDPILRRCDRIVPPSPLPPEPLSRTAYHMVEHWKLFSCSPGNLVVAMFGSCTFCLEIKEPHILGEQNQIKEPHIEEGVQINKGTAIQYQDVFEYDHDGASTTLLFRYAWHPAGRMNVSDRWGYAAATSLDGQFVYVAGGYHSKTPPLKRPYNSQQPQPLRALKSAERFDVNKRCWKRIPDLCEPRFQGKGRVLANGQFCVNLGGPNHNRYGRYSEAFDEAAQQWRVVDCGVTFLHPGSLNETPAVGPIKGYYYYMHVTEASGMRVRAEPLLMRVDYSQLKLDTMSRPQSPFAVQRTWAYLEVRYGKPVSSENMGVAPLPAKLRPNVFCHPRLVAMGKELFVFASNSLLITSPPPLPSLPLHWTCLPLPFRHDSIGSHVVLGEHTSAPPDSDYALRIGRTERQYFE